MDGYIHSLFFSNGNFQSEIFARKARYFFEIIINNHKARNVNEGSIKKFGRSAFRTLTKKQNNN